MLRAGSYFVAHLLSLLNTHINTHFFAYCILPRSRNFISNSTTNANPNDSNDDSCSNDNNLQQFQHRPPALEE